MTRGTLAEGGTMLKKENRISGKKEFGEIKNEGRLVGGRGFGMLVGQIQGSAHTIGKKFGFIVSKKISKRAVDRNRIKRLLAEGVRKNLDKFPEGTRIIFLAKKELLKMKAEEIKKLVDSI